MQEQQKKFGNISIEQFEDLEPVRTCSMKRYPEKIDKKMSLL